MKITNFFTCFLLITIFTIFFSDAFPQNCFQTSVGLPPINDLGAGYFRNFQGGLYPSGSNSRPSSHNNDGLNLASQVVPLDTAGNYNPNTGKIVLLSVGMSNCSQEFQEFMNAINGAAYKNPKLVIINGAQGGQTIDIIINPNAQFWTVINQRLTTAGVSAKQVQAVWFKETQSNPADTSFPNYALGLKNKFKTAMNVMKSKYKNLKLCYNASRIYAGYAASTLNPEPYAYYSGWSVKLMIEDQLNGDTSLNYKGANPNSPWLSWGPYLWADGTTPRLDGLTWTCPTDYNSDGTHPSAAGRVKVASMLINFFSTDETAKPWFIKNLTLNLSVAMEGFYHASSNTLNMKDTVSAYLRNVNSPYAMIDSSKADLDSVSLRGVFKFYNLASGTYYIEVKHRNSIETWSRSGSEPMVFGGISNYIFTELQSRAYGNNQSQIDTSPLRFGIYSGDVNQDGTVDLSDAGLVDNDSYNFITGYVATDVNGDNTVDLSDAAIVDDNSFGFVSIARP
jgi:hypothetical protein